MMSNLVPAFYEWLSKMEENRMACGVILASCKNFSAESLELVKRDMEAQLADTMTMHFAHDKSKNILGILLEQKKLADTHFYALQVKDYLLGRKLLTGGLLIASFPESSRSSAQMLMRMIQEMKDASELGSITVYEQHAANREQEPASILLVNQDETVNEFLRIYLQRKGYQVTVAHDGMDGMEKFREAAYDLVITDLNLPVVSGYQLMEKIRHLGQEAMSKIMVLTDKRLEEDVQKSFALGASDYITKPFSPVELEARVKRLIS